MGGVLIGVQSVVCSDELVAQLAEEGSAEGAGEARRAGAAAGARPQ